MQRSIQQDPSFNPQSVVYAGSLFPYSVPCSSPPQNLNPQPRPRTAASAVAVTGTAVESIPPPASFLFAWAALPSPSSSSPTAESLHAATAGHGVTFEGRVTGTLGDAGSLVTTPLAARGARTEMPLPPSRLKLDMCFCCPPPLPRRTPMPLSFAAAAAVVEKMEGEDDCWVCWGCCWG